MSEDGGGPNLNYFALAYLPFIKAVGSPTTVLVELAGSPCFVNLKTFQDFYEFAMFHCCPSTETIWEFPTCSVGDGGDP